MGQVTNGRSALTDLYSLLRDLQARGELPWLTTKKGEALCLEEGFELKGLHPGVRDRVHKCPQY